MTTALFEMNVAITQLNKAVSFMTMATFYDCAKLNFWRSRSIWWQPHYIFHLNHIWFDHLATFIFVHVPKIMSLPHIYFIMPQNKMTVSRNVMTMALINDYVTFFWWRGHFCKCQHRYVFAFVHKSWGDLASIVHDFATKKL